MIEVQEIPTQGQFVAVWEYNEKVWSGVFKGSSTNILQQYDDSSETFYDVFLRYTVLHHEREDITNLKMFIINNEEK